MEKKWLRNIRIHVESGRLYNRHKADIVWFRPLGSKTNGTIDRLINWRYDDLQDVCVISF